MPCGLKLNFIWVNQLFTLGGVYRPSPLLKTHEDCGPGQAHLPYGRPDFNSNHEWSDYLQKIDMWNDQHPDVWLPWVPQTGDTHTEYGFRRVNIAWTAWYRQQW